MISREKLKMVKKIVRLKVKRGKDFSGNQTKIKQF